MGLQWHREVAVPLHIHNLWGKESLPATQFSSPEHQAPEQDQTLRPSWGSQTTEALDKISDAKCHEYEQANHGIETVGAN